MGHFEKMCRSKSKGRASQIRNRGAVKSKQNEEATRVRTVRTLKRQETPINQSQQSAHPQKEKLVSSNSDSSDEDVFSLSNLRQEK